MKRLGDRVNLGRGNRYCRDADKSREIKEHFQGLKKGTTLELTGATGKGQSLKDHQVRANRHSQDFGLRREGLTDLSPLSSCDEGWHSASQL